MRGVFVAVAEGGESAYLRRGAGRAEWTGARPGRGGLLDGSRVGPQPTGPGAREGLEGPTGRVAESPPLPAPTQPGSPRLPGSSEAPEARCGK